MFMPNKDNIHIKYNSKITFRELYERCFGSDPIEDICNTTKWNGFPLKPVIENRTWRISIRIRKFTGWISFNRSLICKPRVNHWTVLFATSSHSMAYFLPLTRGVPKGCCNDISNAVLKTSVRLDNRTKSFLKPMSTWSLSQDPLKGGMKYTANILGVFYI